MNLIVNTLLTLIFLKKGASGPPFGPTIAPPMDTEHHIVMQKGSMYSYLLGRSTFYAHHKPLSHVCVVVPKHEK